MSDDITFNKTDAETIYTELLQFLEKYVKEPLYPGDERRIFGEAVSAAFVNLLNTMNDTARQKMLRYARGTVLDALGERTDTPRLEASPATTMMRLRVSAPQSSNIIVPKGTRFKPDSSLYFATDALAVIVAGSHYVDIPASSFEGGSRFNGYLPGTITTLVDLIPFIDRVENITASSGGDDGEPYSAEGDERYRERIHLSPSRFSTAGPVGAYEYWAYTADPDIISAKAITPEPGVVAIIPLMKGGELPDETVLEKVLAAVNADERRPLTDFVKALAPNQLSYNISIKYYTTATDEAAVINTVEGIDGAIARYIEWQAGALGRAINPDRLRKFILSPDWGDGLTGAVRLDVVEPSYMELNKSSVARHSGKLSVSHQVVRE